MLTAALNLAASPFLLLLVALMAGGCGYVWLVERGERS